MKTKKESGKLVGEGGAEVELAGKEATQTGKDTNMQHTGTFGVMDTAEAKASREVLSVIVFQEIRSLQQRCPCTTAKGRALKAGLLSAYLQKRPLPAIAYFLLTDREVGELSKRFKTASEGLAILRKELDNFALTFSDLRTLLSILQSIELTESEQAELYLKLARIRLANPQWTNRGDRGWVEREIIKAIEAKPRLAKIASLPMAA